jgi:hypothetical protein
MINIRHSLINMGIVILKQNNIIIIRKKSFTLQ